MGGTVLSIMGSNVAGTHLHSCSIGDQNSVAYILDNQRIACTTSAVAPGVYDVSVSSTEADFRARTHNITVDADVSVRAVVPSGGPARGGTLVLVSGSGLAAGSDHRCKFGRRIVRAEVADGGGLVCTSPEQEHGTASDVSVEVTLNGQQYSQSAVAFAYHVSEQVLALSPSVGPQAGSTRIRVLGSGFQPLPEAVCRFGTGGTTAAAENATLMAAATVRATFVSAAEVRCDSPGAAIAGASSMLWLDFSNESELLARGSVHTSGVPGNPVEAGELWLTRASTLQVRSVVAGAQLMSRHHRVFSASFKLYIGGGTGGEGLSICLGELPDAPFGEEGAGNGLRIALLTHRERLDIYYSDELLVRRSVPRELFRAARFVSVSVVYGLAGLTVRVDGTLLVHEVMIGAWSPLSTWRFGIGARTGQSRTDEHRVDDLRFGAGADVAAHAVWVEVASNGQQFTSSLVPLVYSAPHVVSSVTPEHGPEGGATQVLVSGASFAGGSDYRCRFGASTVNASFHPADGTIRCASSPWPRGSASVEISLNAQQYTSSSVSFTYYSTPTLSAATPRRGPDGRRHDGSPLG